jgi:hypothetical protein
MQGDIDRRFAARVGSRRGRVGSSVAFDGTKRLALSTTKRDVTVRWFSPEGSGLRVRFVGSSDSAKEIWAQERSSMIKSTPKAELAFHFRMRKLWDDEETRELWRSIGKAVFKTIPSCCSIRTQPFTDLVAKNSNPVPLLLKENWLKAVPPSNHAANEFSKSFASSLSSILCSFATVASVAASPMRAISSALVNSAISKEVTSGAMTKSAGSIPTEFML